VAYNLPRADLDDPQAAEAVGPKQVSGDLRVPEGVYRLLYHNPWSRFHLSLAVGYPNLADARRGRRAGVIGASGLGQLEGWWARHAAALEGDLLPGPEGLWDGPEVEPLGNEIFIHGREVTVGCVPVGDAGIEELFLLTDPRRVGGTPVHLFPCRMDDGSCQRRLQALGALRPELGQFWESLGPVYRYFEQHRLVPAVEVDSGTGRYRLVS
jgi:murein L,D-transpeptidase YafK